MTYYVLNFQYKRHRESDNIRGHPRPENIWNANIKIFEDKLYI